MRVLIVKTSSLGDIIHTLPALTDAQQAYQDIVFDWVVEEAFAEIPAWHPAVDRVIPVAIRRWRKQPVKTLMSQEWKEARTALARHHYDLVIDAQGLLKSAWITWMAKGSSAGFDRQSVREPLAAIFYKHVARVEKEMHAVERVRELFAQMLAYAKPETVGDYGISQELFEHSDSGQPYLLFLHGTTRFDKHWPEPYWRRLAKTASEAGYGVKLPWGNEEERERARRICQDVPGAAVLPRLNLHSLACVIHQARAVVSVDTGLGHLTAALGVPNVSLYGSTRPALIGAYGERQVHLSVADLPKEALAAWADSSEDCQIEPAGFAPLTPLIVWQALSRELDFVSTQGSAL